MISKDVNRLEYLRISNEDDDFQRRALNSWNVNPRLIIYSIIFSAIILVMVFLRLYLLFQPRSMRVILFGDSLVKRKDNYIGRMMQKSLRKSYSDIKIYSSGVSGDCISDLRRRLTDDVLERKAFGLLRFWVLDPPDAVIMYWDSDAVDVENSLDEDILHSYVEDLQFVLETLKEKVSFVALGGPTLDGELPYGQNEKDSTLDFYADINRNITTGLGMTYLETRKLFFDNLPDQWSNDVGYLTDDGEHQNIKGASLLISLFEKTVTNWIKTNKAWKG
jgi:hypothetical protein